MQIQNDWKSLPGKAIGTADVIIAVFVVVIIVRKN